MLNPKALWLLLAIPALLFISALRLYQGWRVYGRLGGAKDLFWLFTLRHVGKDLPMIIAFTALIFALSDSYWGTTLVREAHSNAEIVFVMDISASMLAEDAPGQRLQTAKTLAQELIFSLQEPKLGVVIFKGAAFTGLPLTTDRELVAQLITDLDPTWLSHTGSNIADALAQARLLFSQDNQAERIIVLFSDGEVTKGQTREEIRNLFHQNIKVYAIGVGSEAGAVVPDMQGFPRINSHGQLLQSSLNVALLKNIAHSSNGLYLAASDAQTLELLRKEIKQNELKSFRLVERRLSLFHFLVTLAILMLALSQIVRSLPWKELFGAREYI